MLAPPLIPPSPPIDGVMLEERAAAFAKRSFKAETKRAAIDLAIRCIDLTTLEGRDTPGRVRALCAKALAPAPGAPQVAAVCVYPNLVAVAKAALAGSGVKVASVATAFPSGLSTLDVKLRDTEAALAAGADEIDMVIDRGAFLAGDEARVFDEIAAVKRLCGADVHLKAILETGELGSYEATRRASDIALAAGADVIKTSTGKIGVSATLPTALAMAQALRAFWRATGERRGLKLAGGIRTTKAAFAFLALIDETLGAAWLDPELFRIGASALLDDLLLQRAKSASGRYGSIDYLGKE
jgi:deoxyribose-phosphate aldolase